MSTDPLCKGGQVSLYLVFRRIKDSHDNTELFARPDEPGPATAWEQVAAIRVPDGRQALQQYFNLMEEMYKERGHADRVVHLTSFEYITITSSNLLKHSSNPVVPTIERIIKFT